MAAQKVTAQKVSRQIKKTTATKKKSLAKNSPPKKKAEKTLAKKAVTKKGVVKKAAKKTAGRSPAKPKIAVGTAARAERPTSKLTISPDRTSWIDELTQTPLIDDYARQLESFMSAMADGRIEEAEVQRQEQRVVELLREIDPQIEDALHVKVTQLLCELTAYAVIQTLYAMEQARPKTVFQG